MQPDLAVRDTLDLDRYVPALLSLLSGRLSVAAARECRAAAGLGYTDWRVMAQIAVTPHSSAARLCLRSGLDKAAVSRSFASLSERGLVRLEACGRDRRAALSAAGERVHARLLALALAREQRMLAELCEHEADALRGLLHRLIDTLPSLDAADASARPVARPKQAGADSAQAGQGA